jgi:hypothetical protein
LNVGRLSQLDLDVNGATIVYAKVFGASWEVAMREALFLITLFTAASLLAGEAAAASRPQRMAFRPERVINRESTQGHPVSGTGTATSGKSDIKIGNRSQFTQGGAAVHATTHRRRNVVVTHPVMSGGTKH